LLVLMKKHIEDIHSYLTSNHEFWMNESNVVRPDVLWFSVENTDRLLLKIKKSVLLLSQTILQHIPIMIFNKQ
jgi:hypothetical protein